MCNKCISPLKLLVRTLLRRGVLDTTSCDKACQLLATGRWFSPVSSTNKTDCHDIYDILLEVALSTIKLSQIIRIDETTYQERPGFLMEYRSIVKTVMAFCGFILCNNCIDNKKIKTADKIFGKEGLLKEMLTNEIYGVFVCSMD